MTVLEREITIARIKVNRAWNQACKFDGADVSERFVVFSDNNPHLSQLRKASKHLSQLLKVHKITS